MISATTVGRFHENTVKTSHCWIWQGKPDVYGYGRIYANGIQYKAHRLSWMIHHRKKIPDGMCILHNCPGGDNRLCVNPKHLWLGTNIDNMKDRKTKGGYPTGDAHPLRKHPELAARGEQSPKTHFMDGDIRTIRKLYDSGRYSQPQLGDMFQCSHSTIGRIVHRKVWKHI